MEAEAEELDQFTRFVALIEQGATRDEACAAVLCQLLDAAPAERTASGNAPVEGPAEELAEVLAPAEPRPRLEGQAALAPALCHAEAALRPSAILAPRTGAGQIQPGDQEFRVCRAAAG